MKRFVTTALALVLTLGCVSTLRAQDTQDVTVRQINEIPQDNIDALMAGGTSLTSQQVAELTTPPLANQKVRFTAVVLSNPRNSGLGNPNAEGFPSRIHVFVRDTSAVSQGVEGMGVQLVDGAYQTTGLLNTAPGDVITVVGIPSAFTGSGGASMQVSPESIELLGSYEDFGLPASILDPVVLDGTSVANMSVEGDGIVQVNWRNLPDLNGQYIRIEGATLLARSLDNPPGRHNWLVSSDGGETVLNFYDVSTFFRNDRVGGYNPDVFNLRDGDFVPPPPGASVNIQGFLVFQGDDPFVRANPSGALLSIAPFNDEDLEVTETPPEASTPSRPESLLAPGTAFTVTTDATADASRSVQSVEVVYYTSSDATEKSVTATLVEGDTYQAELPGVADGDFLVYRAKVTDSSGAQFESGSTIVRALSAIDEISDVQEVFGGATGSSPLAGYELDMDITATVQSNPGVSGFVSIQDDAGLGPWTGILIGDSVTDLAQGDQIRITKARVVEQFDVTQLRDVTYEKTGTGDFLGYKSVSTTALQDSETSEAHEGMLVRFDDVVITGILRFGEWSFATKGTEANLVGDDASSSFDETVLAQGQERAYIQGIWWFSFGAYKLVPESNDVDLGAVVNVGVDDDDLPTLISLGQNYPNPFNPVTTIEYTLKASGSVRLDVYDVLGRNVATLVDAPAAPGTYQVRFDATDLASGVYLYRLTAGAQVINRTMHLMK